MLSSKSRTRERTKHSFSGGKQHNASIEKAELNPMKKKKYGLKKVNKVAPGRVLEEDDEADSRFGDSEPAGTAFRVTQLNQDESREEKVHNGLGSNTNSFVKSNDGGGGGVSFPDHEKHLIKELAAQDNIRSNNFGHLPESRTAAEECNSLVTGIGDGHHSQRSANSYGKLPDINQHDSRQKKEFLIKNLPTNKPSTELGDNTSAEDVGVFSSPNKF